MVQEIMGQVVANVAKDTTTKDRSSDRPVPVKDCMCEFPEWSGKSKEKSRWHDQSELIHW